MIKLINVNKYYNNNSSNIHILKNISLQVPKGNMVSIMGASGSGKSTLLNIIGMLDNFDSGDFFLDNILIKNLTADKASEYRSNLVGFIFQSFNLIPYKTALDNISLPLLYRGYSYKERAKLGMLFLEKMGLTDRANHTPNELSGGQKQRIAIGRALITNPKVILADEPTGSLDSETSKDVLKLLKDINQEGVTIIIVTHDKDVATSCNKIIHIKDGVIA